MKRSILMASVIALAAVAVIAVGYHVPDIGFLHSHAGHFAELLAFGSNKNIRAFIAKKTEALTAARAITAAAEAANRDLTEEEQAQFEAHMSAVTKANASIAREQALLEEEQSLAASANPAAAAGARSPVITVHDRREDDPRRGFAHLGEFASAVAKASLPGADADDRLSIGIGAAAPSTGNNEGNGQDGGFLVPPQYSQDIWTLSISEDSLVPLTDNTDVAGNSMVFPKDETTPWGGDGVTVGWQNEMTTGGLSKLKLGESAMRLKKLIGLVPVSNELLEDTNALGSYLPNKLGTKIRWKANEALVWGSGVGQPKGAMKSGAAIVVAKDSGQAASTLSAMNIANMIARLPEGSFGRAMWIINNDVLPALFTLQLGNYPIYLPAVSAQGGIQGNPYGTLMGRPIMVSQHAKSFSSQGDVNLLDMSYYRTITKAGGVQTAVSAHLYFDADAMAFRVVYRIDGESAIVNPISPANGTNTLSPFIQLGAR